MDTTLANSIQSIVKYVESNPLIITLTSGGAVVWLFANLKSIFNAIANAVKACISFTVTNIYDDQRGVSGCGGLKIKQIAFNNMLIQTRALWERTVNLDLSNNIDVSKFANDTDATSTYESSYISNGSAIAVSSKAINAYGFSIRVIFGKLCFVDRSYRVDGQKMTMNTSIRVFFASKKKFMKKLEDAVNDAVAKAIEATYSSSYVNVFSSSAIGQKMKRSLGSIFTKDNVHMELFNSIKSFIDSKDVYKKLNYPYNYCALLYGVPGSGKTSTILAIASELKRDIHYINISQTSIDNVLKILNDNPGSSIYVFEDIDAVSYKGANARETDDSKDNDHTPKDDKLASAFGISLSDLLNMTDGLLASDGTICLFTTNHIEKLDPAFLRAGRMNKTIEFTYMNPETSRMMVETYLGKLDDCLMKDKIKPAELQECILDILLRKNTIDSLKAKFCEKQMMCIADD